MQAVHQTLAELAAAHSLGDLPPFRRPHPLKGDRQGQFSLELPGGLRLILECSQDPPPFNQDGSINWHAVDAVLVLDIENYHRG